MKPAKFIVVVICALTAMLSIPHVSLWGLSVGSEKGYAATSTQVSIKEGDSCGLADAFVASSHLRCARAKASSDTNLYLVKCQGLTVLLYTWEKVNPNERFMNEKRCSTQCNSFDPSHCTEPLLEVSATNNGVNVANSASTSLSPNIIIKSQNKNPNHDYIASILITARNLQHNINYEIIRNSARLYSYIEGCSNRADCQTTIPLNRLQDGDEVRYWSEISFSETNGGKTTIAEPSNSFQSFRISGTSTPPPPSPPTGAGGLAANPSSLSVNVGGRGTVTISGGTTPYSATADASKATVAISGSTLTVTGVAVGTTAVTVIDSSSPQKNVQIQVTVNPAGTSTGGINFIQPDNPRTGAEVALRFENVPTNAENFELYVYHGSSGSPVYSRAPRKDSRCPSTCVVTFTPNREGTYEVDFIAKDASNNKVGDVRGAGFTVALSGHTDTGHCCVWLKDERVVYETNYINDLSCRKAAEDAGGRYLKYENTNCNNVDDRICDDFCEAKMNNPNVDGRCGSYFGSDPNRDFENVCIGNTCRCSTGSNQRSRNVACNEACLTDSSTRIFSTTYGTSQRLVIPYGDCTNDPQGYILSWAIATQSSASAGSYVQRPVPIGDRGDYRCAPDEQCVCTFVDFSAFTSRPSPVTSIPGTIEWNAPDALDPAPKQPNQRLCTTGTNATITASFGGAQTVGAGAASATRLIQAGDTVTIAGNVGKLSDQCDGYNFTCRQQLRLDCEIKTGCGGFCQNLDYKECPADFPTQVHAEGKGRKWNWGLIIGAALAATGIFLPGSAFSAATTGGQLFAGGTSLAASSAIEGTQCDQGGAPPFAPVIYNLLQSRSQQANCNRCQGYAGICVSTGECTSTGPCPNNDFYSCRQPGNCVDEGGVCATQSACNQAGGLSLDISCPSGNVCCFACDGNKVCDPYETFGCSDCSGSGGQGGEGDRTGCSAITDRIQCLLNTNCAFSNGRCVEISPPLTGPGNSGPGGLCQADAGCTTGFCYSGTCAAKTRTQAAAEACNVCKSQGNPGACYNSAGWAGCKGAGERACATGDTFVDCSTITATVTAKPTVDITGKATTPLPQVGSLPIPDLRGFYGTGRGGGAAAGGPSSAAMGTAVAVLDAYLNACLSQEQQSKCFSVCGRVYEVGPSPAPVCTGPVIGVKDVPYKCLPGSCGGFENKRVKIVIKDPNGVTVVDDLTTTDSNGDFSYTFTAPAADGEFTAIVSVPKDGGDGDRICPAVCVPMWMIDNGNCIYTDCGSGCGPDNVRTFATQDACEAKLRG